MDALLNDLANLWTSVGTERFIILVLMFVIYFLWNKLDTCQKQYIDLLQKTILAIEQNTMAQKIIDTINKAVQEHENSPK